MATKNKTPLRQCTGCREMKSKKEMIRVLKTPENEIVLDATGRKNGRGAYVSVTGVSGKSSQKPWARTLIEDGGTG